MQDGMQQDDEIGAWQKMRKKKLNHCLLMKNNIKFLILFNFSTVFWLMDKKSNLQHMDLLKRRFKKS